VTAVIALAGGKQVFDIVTGADDAGRDYAVYGVGLLTAAVVGYAAIAFLLRFLRVRSLAAFIVYRVGLGALVLALAAAGQI